MTILLDSFHDELEKISGAGRLARIETSLANNFRRLERGQGNRYQIQKKIEDLLEARKRAMRKHDRRKTKYEVGTTGRLLTRDSLLLNSGAYERRVSSKYKKPEYYISPYANSDSAKRKGHSDAVKYYRSLQTVGPAKAGGSIPFVQYFRSGGTGVPARSPSVYKQLNKADQANWKKSKREVDDFLSQAAKKENEATRAAKKEVYQSSIKGRMDRIKRIAAQRKRQSA